MDTLIHMYPLFIICLKENVIIFSEALHVLSLLKGELFQMHEKRMTYL